MQKFTLEIFFQIIGIGAASGLLYKDNSLFIISDTSGFLYEYDMNLSHLKKYPIIENPAENTIKSEKSDFESIALFDNSLCIFGSGSTEKRNKMVVVHAGTKQLIETVDLSDLYLVMQSFGKIKPEEFNIEGDIYNGENWFLFNRGNGISNHNSIFSIQGKNLINDFNILSNTYKLPKIKGVRSSFTDAIVVEDKIYFLATAEDTLSTYEDGAILGSFIGRINIKTMKIDYTKKISDTNKFEGITLYANSKNKLEFLLCEDNDTAVLESTIYKLILEK